MKRVAITISLIIAFLLFGVGRADAQWKQTAGPEGGVIRTLGSNGGSTVFAAVDGGGIYRSTDNGRHWKPSGLDNLIVNAIFFKDNYVFAAIYQDLYRSGDNGDTWTDLNFKDFNYCATVKNNYLFVCGYDNLVLRSSDDGDTWAPMSNGITASYLSSMTSNDEYVFVAGYNSLFRSSDNGENWVSVGTGFPPAADMYSMSIGHLIVSGSILFAEVYTTSSAVNGVYRSTDNGANWSITALVGLNVASLTGMGSSIFAVVPKYLEGNGIYRTDDDGVSWKKIDLNLISTDITAITSNSKFVFLGLNQLGISRLTSKGDKWVVTNTGLRAANVSAMAMLDDSLYAGNADGGGVFYSDDKGRSWTDYNAGLTDLNVHAITVDADSSKVFAGTAQGVFYTDPVHRVWTPINNGLNHGGPDGEISITSLVVKGRTLFAGAKQGVYRSMNGGASWDHVMELVGNVGISQIAIGSNVVYAIEHITHDRPRRPNPWIMRSTDNGTTWEEIGDSGLPSKPYVIAAKGKRVFAGSPKGVYRSEDKGLTWTLALPGTPNTTITSILYYHNTVVAGTATGQIYISHDEGNTWESVSSGLPDGLQIDSLTTNRRYLFSAVYNKSVWRLDLDRVRNNNNAAISSLPDEY